MPHYDLAIIGSGSGNSLITPFWDDKRVALIDGGTFGGTCLNVGCIPTKMFVYPASLAAAPTEAGRLGVDLTLDGVRWNEIRDRVFGRIDAISAGGRRYRDEELDNVDLYAEYVKFTGPRALRTASGVEITADRIVIAAGSRARIPDVPGVDLPQVHTSDTVMRIDGPPKKAVVVGGGYIAAEFASIFHGVGTDVVQVNRSQSLLRGNDQEISRRFAIAAAGRWDLKLGWRLLEIQAGDSQRPADGAAVTVVFGNDAGETLKLQADVVLLATGRIPNSDTLDLDVAGFDLRADGTLDVDPFQQVLSNGVAVDGIYALGDIANRHQLKHVANREARVVSHNLEHPQSQRPLDTRAVPFAVFSTPQIAAVGLTEDQAREQAGEGVEIVTAVQDYGSTAYGWAMEDREGIVKLVAEKATGKLLGAHIMGHEASLLIQPLIQAITTSVPVYTMARGQYWIHPALTEVVENALLSLGVDEPADAPL